MTHPIEITIWDDENKIVVQETIEAEECTDEELANMISFMELGYSAAEAANMAKKKYIKEV